MPQVAAAGGVAGRRRGQHHDRRAGRARDRLADLLGQLEAVHLGHVARRAARARTARRASAASRSAASAAWPASTSRRPHAASWRAASARMRRLVALSSTTRTGRSRQRRTRRRRRDGAVSETPKTRGEVERAAAARLALDPDPPAHHLDAAAPRSPGPGRCRRTGASSSRRPA